VVATRLQTSPLPVANSDDQDMTVPVMITGDPAIQQFSAMLRDDDARNNILAPLRQLTASDLIDSGVITAVRTSDTAGVIYVRQSSTLEEILGKLEDNRACNIIVTMGDGNPVGMISYPGLVGRLLQYTLQLGQVVSGILDVFSTENTTTTATTALLEIINRTFEPSYSLIAIVDSSGRINSITERDCHIKSLPPGSGRLTGEELARAVIEKGEITRLKDVRIYRSDDCPDVQFPVHDLIGLPIIENGQTTGVIAFHNPRDRSELNAFEIVLAQRIAKAIATGSLLRKVVNYQTGCSEGNSKLLGAIEQTADSVMITDRNGLIEYVNAAFEKSSGYSRMEVLGKKPNIVKSGQHSQEFFLNLWTTILSGRFYRGVFINCRKNGSLYREEKTISPLINESGKITHFVSTSKDVSERFLYEERLKYLAHHDSLTKLPNRTLFLDRLTRALVRAERIEKQVAVLFVDLDRFKIINDTLGHDIGDKLLQTVATRLRNSIRKGDTIARLGGDEFAIILEDIQKFDNVMPVIAKINKEFNEPCVIDNRDLSVNASIGIAIYPEDGKDISSLLRHADIAMYREKEQGGSGYRFYSHQMSTETDERLSLETAMRRALETGDQFILHYQPQLNLTSGEIIATEALVRWQHPELGMIPPMKFIPMAEETGLIAPLGDMIMRKACEQTRFWQKQGYTDLAIAVNVSGRQFKNKNFIEHIASVLDETGLAPHCLEIEITESVMIQNMQTTMTILNQLRNLGTRIVIDDFGTGYSSLAYLKKLPIDTLKIDKTFVQDITHDKDDAAIVNAITTMARTLDINAVAEGVETRAQLGLLRDYHCDIAQGYYLGKPMPHEDFGRHLQVFGIPSRRRN